MKRLPEAVKRRIVEHLACYRSHREVTSLIVEEFGAVLTPRHVRAYDPSSFQFAASRAWRDYHAHARKRFEMEIADVPIAHRAVRLRWLGKVYEEAMEAKDFETARKAIETAAKEAGNVFTNIQKVQGAPLPGAVAERTSQETRNMLADRLREAIERLSNARK